MALDLDTEPRDRPETPGEALEALAETLHDALRRFNPEDYADWNRLSDDERHPFRACVARVIDNSRRVEIASLADLDRPPLDT